MSSPSSPAPSSKRSKDSSIPANPTDPLKGKGGGKKGNNDMTQTLMLQMLMNIRDQISEQGKILKCLQIDMEAQGLRIQNLEENMEHCKWALWEDHRSQTGIWGAEINIPEVIVQKWLKSREKMQEREKQLLEGGILLNNTNQDGNTTAESAESGTQSQDPTAVASSADANRRRILEECFSFPCSAIRSRADKGKGKGNPIEETKQVQKREEELMEGVKNLNIGGGETEKEEKRDYNDENLEDGEEKGEEEEKVDDDDGKDTKLVGEEGEEK